MRTLTLLMMLTCCGLASVAFAQPDLAPANTPAPAPPMRPGVAFGMNAINVLSPSSAPVMEATPGGLFLLQNGALAQFDPITLKQVGKTKELFGALPAQPKLSDVPTDAERTALQDWLKTVNTRMAPAAMVTDDKLLLIVIGDTFFKVNQATGAIEVQSDLTDKNAAANPQNAPFAGVVQMGNRQTAAPMLKRNGDMLYILRDASMISVNITDGKVAGRGEAPKEMQPLQNANMQQIYQAIGIGGWRGGRVGRGGGGPVILPVNPAPAVAPAGGGIF